MHSLGGATSSDTAEYLGYRLKRAGADREPFSSDAIALLHEEPHGAFVTSTVSPPTP